jgi:site-specific DNA-methyltransferase (cytosine-N4-specific)
MPKSDLPFGSEFSPSQIELPVVLEFAHKFGGDWKAFENAVRKRYFDSHTKTNDYNRGKLANNCKLGMIAYGIIDREARLTEFGSFLFKVRGEPDALYGNLAKHILLNLYGMTVVQTIQDMQAGGETVDLVKLREWLDERGVHFPRGGKHASILRLWLEKAGVFGTGWTVNEKRYREILGTGTREIEALAGLNREQKFFLRTLVNLGGGGPYPSNDIEKLATATYGIRFNEKMLPKTVLYPLEKTGFITLTRETAGRGAKPFMVKPTAKLIKDLLEPLLIQLEKQAGEDLRPFLRKPLADIVGELDANDRHIRGLALEALAFKLMRLIDLDYVATRLRGTATGGAEVDVIFESCRLVFSRWQIQCKNTGRVALDDVAKEVGLTHFLKSNVIVMVSTGEIGSEARRYANKIMADSNLCIVMVDSKDVRLIVKDPAAIVDIFHREASHAMKLKALTLDA